MARSNKKSASKKPAKKAAPKKAATRKAPAAKAKSAPPRKAKPAKPAAARKAAKPAKLSKSAPVRSANGKARKANGKNNQAFAIINHKEKERRLDPFTRGQKEKLLQLRDAMVDSMAGVAQDTLRRLRHAPGRCRERRLRS